MPLLTVVDITVPDVTVLPRIVELDPEIVRQSCCEHGARSA